MITKHAPKLQMLIALIFVMTACVPQQTPTPDPSTWPSWTLMIYMNGDNNLAAEAINDILELGYVGSLDRMNIIVQLDLPGDNGTYIYRINKGDSFDTATPLQTLSEKNMADFMVLMQFYKWATEAYPADHYALVIWGHGDGWRAQQQKINLLMTMQSQTSSVPVTGFRAVSSDDTSGDIMYLNEVQRALNEAQTQLGAPVLDLIGFDACLMGMLEVAYQLKDNAHYMIASEEVVPGSGWPYQRILTDLVNSYASANEPRVFARRIVEIYGAYYDQYGENDMQTMGAYNLQKVTNVTSTLDKTIELHNSLPEDQKEWEAIGEARSETEQFHAGCIPDGVSDVPNCWGVDLTDFVLEAGNRVTNTEMKLAFTGLGLTLKLFEDRFIVTLYRGKNHPGANGVAIYFPSNSAAFNADPDHYGYLEENTNHPISFVQDTLWDNWLREQYLAHFTSVPGGGGVNPGGGSGSGTNPTEDCEGFGESCMVHPDECDGRGTSWQVHGTIHCVDDEPVCKAEVGEDYCTGPGNNCGNAYGGSCVADSDCSLELVCAKNEWGDYRCNWACTLLPNWCWTPDELSKQPGFGCSR